MPVFKISDRDVPALLRAHARRVPELSHNASITAANRARTMLVRASPVYTGIFRNAWRVRLNPGKNQGATVENDAPHAGIIEKGARPHPVSREGIEALTLWAKRKLLHGASRAAAKRVSKKNRGSVTADIDAEAKRIAFAIAKKISQVGQKGLFLVEKRMGKFSKFYVTALNDEIRKMLAARMGG